MWCSTSKLIGENGHLQPEDRSLIAASLKNIYKPLIASGYTAPCPTLGDLYRDLNKSNLRRAKQLALMLDVFANGSLQAFSHTTNVDMNNRLICFNIQSLGDVYKRQVKSMSCCRMRSTRPTTVKLRFYGMTTPKTI